MKFALRIFGVLAVVFALYVIIGEQLVGSSGEAYVNTRLSAVKSPVQGTLQLATAPVGGRVVLNEVIGNVAGRVADTTALNGLEQARAITGADIETIGASGPAQGETLARLEARAAALDRLLEEKRAAQLTGQAGALRSTVNGVLWSISSFSGEFVSLGDTVAQVADCSTPFVHASVDQRLYNRLSVGDPAQFRLHDGPAMEASVVLLAGTGPRTLLETLAINPTDRLLEGYSVLLAAPGLTGNGACPLGKTGRVVFSSGPLSGVGEWLSTIGL
jgi:hypothetical protein